MTTRYLILGITLMFFGGGNAPADEPDGAKVPSVGEFVGVIRSESGAAVPGAAVALVGDSAQYSDEFTRVVSANSEGRFRFEGVPSGLYEARVYEPGLWLDPPTKVVIAGRTQADLVLSPCIVAKVRFTDGKEPVAGARVWVYREEPGGFGKEYFSGSVLDSRCSRSILTGPDGSVSLNLPFPTGAWRDQDWSIHVRCQAEGYRTAIEETQIESDELSWDVKLKSGKIHVVNFEESWDGWLCVSEIPFAPTFVKGLAPARGRFTPDSSRWFEVRDGKCRVSVAWSRKAFVSCYSEERGLTSWRRSRAPRSDEVWTAAWSGLREFRVDPVPTGRWMVVSHNPDKTSWYGSVISSDGVYVAPPTHAGGRLYVVSDQCSERVWADVGTGEEPSRVAWPRSDWVPARVEGLPISSKKDSVGINVRTPMVYLWKGQRPERSRAMWGALRSSRGEWSDREAKLLEAALVRSHSQCRLFVPRDGWICTAARDALSGSDGLLDFDRTHYVLRSDWNEAARVDLHFRGPPLEE